MKTPVFLATALLLGGTLAGCVTTIPKDAPETATDPLKATFQLVRHFQVDLNKETVKAAEAADEPLPEAFVRSSLMVGIRNVPVDASLLTLLYTSRDGRFHTLPLATLRPGTLAPGTDVEISDVAPFTPVVLQLAGVEVARRDSPANWWSAGGYPLGFALEPGTSLGWRMGANVAETLELTDLESRDEPVIIDRMAGKIKLELTGDLSLAYTRAPESISATQSHLARPLAWDMKTRTLLSLTGEFAGRNVSIPDGAVEGGMEFLPTFDLDANGRLWVRDPGSPVRADLDGGRVAVAANGFAWLTGTDAALGSANFSCAGATRADRCRPTEIPWDEMRHSQSLGPAQEPLDGHHDAPDPNVLRRLAALFGEDLRVGDSLVARVDVRGEDLDEPDPQLRRFSAVLEMKAVGEETATVAAGTFETLKVVESLRFSLDLGPSADGSFLGLQVEDRLVEGTLWLDKASFVPVRAERRMPLDFTKLVRDVVAAAGPMAWEDAPFLPLAPEDVTVTVQSVGTVELTRHAPGARFAPWLVLGLFSSASGLLPMAAMADQEDEPVPPYAGTPWDPTGQPPYYGGTYDGGW